MPDDLSLREDVERELGWEPVVRSAEIGVAVRDGVVVLSGAVDSFAVKRSAERAAERVRGVRAVCSQLDVKPAISGGRTDPDIAWAVANVLAWNALVPGERIRVAVSEGWVTLEGTVDWRFQRTAAEDAVADLAGVVGVCNLINVSPPVPVEETKEEIETALGRNAEVDARRIIVEVRGDCVTLWGAVDSWVQREAAEHAAWSAPGVREVSNHITVEAGVPVG